MADMEEIQDVQESIPETSHKEPQKPMRGKRKRKGRHHALLLLSLLLIVAVIGGWWWMSSRTMDTTTRYWFDKLAQDGTLEGKTPQEVQGLLNAVVEEGMFNVSINARAVFPDGKSEGSLGIENIPQNRYYCRVILKRDDDGSVLYESKGLKPGQYIDKVKLKKNLSAGEYPCTAQIVATDPESLDDVGQVQVKIQIIVVN